MYKSKLPYRYWFITMHLLAATKKCFSTKEIQRQLRHKRYAPIWLSGVIPKEKIREKQHWVHIAIRNAKRQLLNGCYNVKP